MLSADAQVVIDAQEAAMAADLALDQATAAARAGAGVVFCAAMPVGM
jgi:hypothetical protein